jgi:hypothetical protein
MTLIEARRIGQQQELAAWRREGLLRQMAEDTDYGVLAPRLTGTHKFLLILTSLIVGVLVLCGLILNAIFNGWLSKREVVQPNVYIIRPGATPQAIFTGGPLATN